MIDPIKVQCIPSRRKAPVVIRLGWEQAHYDCALWLQLIQADEPQTSYVGKVSQGYPDSKNKLEGSHLTAVNHVSPEL